MLFVASQFSPSWSLRPTGKWPSEFKNDYPSNPQDYIKIALYGGSAGFGYLSERNMLAILEHDLKKIFPDKKFYVKTYANPGHPYHNVQASFARADIKLFDYLITYTGTNEGQVYLDSSGYFRKPEYKAAKYRNFSDDPIANLKIRPGYNSYGPVMKFIRNYSRLYSFSLAIIKKMSPAPIEPKLYHFWNFKVFSDEIIFPKIEVEKISTNLEQDFKELSLLAQENNKQIIHLTEVTNPFWKPGFSIFSSATSPQQKLEIEKNYNEAKKLFEGKKYAEAQKKLKNALAIDTEPAILHFYLGLTLIALNKVAEGKKELALAITLDPWNNRANSKIYEIEKNVALENPKHNTFLDATEDFHHLFEQGLNQQEIFSDFMHPSMLGHMVLANKLLCAISNKIDPTKSICRNISKIDAKKLLATYKEEMQVTPYETSENLFMSARFNIGMSDFVVAYPEDILIYGESFLEQFIESSEKNDDNMVRYIVFKALSVSKRGDYNKAIMILNDGINKYGKLIPAYLNQALNNGLFINEALANRGIIYDDKIKLFTRKSV